MKANCRFCGSNFTKLNLRQSTPGEIEALLVDSRECGAAGFLEVSKGFPPHAKRMRNFRHEEERVNGLSL